MKSNKTFLVFGVFLTVTLTLRVAGQTGDVVTAGVDRLAKSLEIHGFISQGWMRSTDNNWLATTDHGSFDFNEFGLSFSGNVSDDVRVGLQLLSRTLGDLSEDGLQIDWAYADYYVNQHFGWQVGRTKTPIGLYGDVIDFDSVRTFIFLPQGNYSEINRDQTVATNGTLFYGNFSNDGWGSLSYSSWIGEIAFGSESGEARATEDNADNLYKIKDMDADYAFGTRLLWETPLDGFSATGTLMRIVNTRITGETTLRYEQATFGAIPTGSQVSLELPRLDIATFGFEYTFKDLVLATEYMSQRSKAVVDLPGEAIRHSRFYREGYYLSATYQLNGNLSVGTYYSARYNDAADKDGSDLVAQGRNAWEGWQKDTALALRYDFKKNWSLKVEYHWMDGTALVLPSENDPSHLKRRWELLALKVTYAF